MPLIRKVLKLLIGMVVIAVLVGILANLLGTPHGPLQIILFACLFVAALIAYIALEFADQTREKNEGLVQRNRRRMLEKVRNFWIDGVLNQSLYNLARIELGLVEQPDAIEHPWRLVVQQPERALRLLPDGMSMHEVFEQFDKTLLLLGAPGSGKTTLLLELAHDLIKHAEQDPDHPIPVVFNLSSWARRRPSIMEWLVDELNERYDVPRKLGERWVKNDQVLPLLDGLDEVALQHQSACVEAINAFHKEHGLLPLAVCSRVADYEALTVRLRLVSAATIQPLTRLQVDGYLRRAGTALSGVRAALHEDKTLWELLDTPLMLSILALAYQDRMASDVRIARFKGTLEARRATLFDAYIEAMFRRREDTSPYTPKQTGHWLCWLAHVMVQRDQTVFYLESMQPDWLRTRRQQTVLNVLSTIIVGFLFGLTGVLMYDPLNPRAARVLFGVIAAVLGPSLVSLDEPKEIRPAETLKFYWPGIPKGLALGLIFSYEDWKLGLAVGILAVLFATVRPAEIITRTAPNQGIHQSLRNALVFGLLTWLIASLLIGILLWLNDNPYITAWPNAPTLGLFVGLLFGLRKGGIAYIRHVILRAILWRNGVVTWNYVRFLDYASERIFLRKVGGGYIFVHRLLMEHFANLEPQPAEV